MKAQYPSMRGKTCVVTGGSSGIGEATALALARLGAEVVIVNHSRERGQAALDEICVQSGNRNIHLCLADLSSQADIIRLADELKTRFPQIHVLINVAGSMFRGIHYSPDHLEMNFALNYLSEFLLTNLLLDTLVKSAPARIINVSSIAHLWGRIDLEDLQNTRHYSMFSAYGASKLAITLFTRELARRLENTGVTAYSVHPGIVATKIIARVIDHPLVSKLCGFLFRSPEEGAAGLVWLAASENITQWNGEYIVNKKPGWCSKTSRDLQLAQKLWAASEEYIRYPSSDLLEEREMNHAAEL